MGCFVYGQKETDHLSRRCKKMGALIERLGPIERPVDSDLFESLVTSIVAQQISGKAAATVCSRLRDKAGGVITPESMAALPVEEVQSCGTSMRKASYIRGVVDAALAGELRMESLRDAPDDEVVRRLSALKGVGRWTAEMLMIFCLQRPDIVSDLDLGIRRGMMALYRKKALTPAQFASYRKRYSPYGSVASLYLWALAERPELMAG